MEVKDYRDLRVWQMGLDLAEAIYSTTARFPASEAFGLVAQLRRAAVSIPSNIAEGHARASTREFLRFISIAMGSIAELETQLILAVRLDYFDQQVLDGLLAQSGEIGRMLRGLQRKLGARLSPPNPSAQPLAPSP